MGKGIGQKPQVGDRKIQSPIDKLAGGVYESRRDDCRRELSELKRSTGLKYPVRYCEIASVGHPNQAGARAYADATRKVLTPFFP